MNSTEYNPSIQLDEVSRLREISDLFSRYEDAYVCAHLCSADHNVFSTDEQVIKIDGIAMALTLKGHAKLQVNTYEVEVRPGSLLVVSPNMSVASLGTDVSEENEAYVLFFDKKFLQGVNINLTSISLPMTYTRPQPIIYLNNEEIEVLKHYCEMLYLNTRNVENPQLGRNIASSLIAAMFYQVVVYYYRRIGADTGEERQLTRRHDYVRDFIKLVHINYTRERSVAYYASKLYISSKYLSLLVKEATGRSAAAWIDEFVIMEAKNMLRFSGKNIQQVAYALNFSTQSSFGKYFKHLTGMSPTEYQKS